MKNVLLAFVLLVFSACEFLPIKPPPVPDNVTIEQECDAACKNMKALKYPGYQGTPTGVSCSQVCVEMETGNPSFPFHGRCIAEAASHAEINKCYED